jgi:hypothetical protein
LLEWKNSTVPQNHPAVDSKNRADRFAEFLQDGNLLIHLDLYVFSKLAEYHAVRDEIYSSIYKIFEDERVKMPVLSYLLKMGDSRRTV